MLSVVLKTLNVELIFAKKISVVEGTFIYNGYCSRWCDIVLAFGVKTLTYGYLTKMNVAEKPLFSELRKSAGPNTLYLLEVRQHWLIFLAV